MADAQLENGNYYIMIPASVRYDNRLTPLEKLLYGEVATLSSGSGECWASNSYFAKIYNRDVTIISKSINHLISFEYLSCRIDKSKGNIRYLKPQTSVPNNLLAKTPIAISENTKTYTQKCQDPIGENTKTYTQKCQDPIGENTKENIRNNKRINKSMSESKVSDLPPAMELILNDKSLYPISEAKTKEWAALYPAVDIMQELRKMKGWLDANPKRRKTKNGIQRFINAWLSKEQDKGRQLQLSEKTNGWEDL